MYIIDVSDPITLLLLLTATILLIFLGKEIKKPAIPAIALVLFLIFVLMHSIQYATLTQENYEQYKIILSRCLTIDLTMIFITFFSYLWVDDIACKFYKKKSIDNSLDWFWGKV
jgi:hypothetical protein